jgi:lipid-A-disaccharide synthase
VLKPNPNPNPNPKPKPIRILLSSGEASGDLYASELLRELREREPKLEAFGLGGDRSKAAGAELLAHLDEISVIGLVEVVRKLPALQRAMSRLTEAARTRRPDAAVLVDFSGFHLRLARRLRSLGVPIIYYVSPQVWAWRRGRVRAIRELVAEMLVILPFEEAFYRDEGVAVRYVGHPLVDLVASTRDRETFCRDVGLDPARRFVILLPGSRRREIELHLPVFREVIERLSREKPEVQIAVSRAPTVAPPVLEAALGPEALEDARVLHHHQGTYDGLRHAAAAVVASGTATVEAALAGTPMVVVYRVGRASYALGRSFVRVPFFSMVNLIAGRAVVPELIQDDMTADAILRRLVPLLDDPSASEEMKRGLREVKAKLGGGGASSRAADAVLSILRSRESGL